jgi:hypothetical protein
MASIGAGGHRLAVAKRAFVALEGGEYGAALRSLVAVVNQEAGHGDSLAPDGHPDIGTSP